MLIPYPWPLCFSNQMITAYHAKSFAHVLTKRFSSDSLEMLALYKGRVFEPCCASGGMLVQSARFGLGVTREALRKETVNNFEIILPPRLLSGRVNLEN